MYKQDLELNNLQWLIFHKTKLNERNESSNPVRRPNPLRIKKNCLVDKQILGPCQRTEQTVKHAGDGDTDCSWCTWNGPIRVVKRIGTQGLY